MSDKASVTAPPTTPRGRLLEIAIGAAWLVGVCAALQILEQLLGPANLGGVIFGALLADLAATRAGVRWEWDEAPLDAPRGRVVRVLAGALVGILAAGAAVALSAVMGWVHVSGPGQPRAALAFAVVRAVGVATRDEILFRGLPLFVASRAAVPRVVARSFAALASGATILFVQGATAEAVVLATAGGWLFACLWERDRGGWAAVGAHAAWLIVVGSALHGGLVDLEWSRGDLTVGASASGPPTWVAAAMLLGASALVLRAPRERERAYKE